MIEVEIQKLTAAIEALTKAVLETAVPRVFKLETPTNPDKLRQDDQSYRDDDAVREAMQAERTAMMKKIDGAMRDVVNDAISRPKPVEDAQLADLYKAEQAKAKRKAAKVTKEETEALIEAAKPVENTECTDQPLKDKEDSPKSPEPKKIAANIGEGDLKALAMEIARADNSARTIILEILGEHGAKTITQLDPKNYRAVHGRFLSLAHDIAKDGEEI